MTVDSFLNGDFMDAIDDEDIEEDEQVHLIHPSWSSILFYFFKAQSNEDLDTEGAMESDDDGSFRSIDDLDGTSPFISSCKYFSPSSDR